MAKIVKDLSKDQFSATSVYIAILPELEKLNKTKMSRDDKVEKAKIMVIQSLCRARAECGTRKSISQDYIVKVRMIISKHQTIDQIIQYLNNAINLGKNYTKEN